jgi:A/G-specific adenine glycosylase
MTSLQKAIGEISTALLSWYDQQGRKLLPWRQKITPYRVWLSEIMLQQTQVNTVIPYFERFLNSFPTLKTLANADEEVILSLWSGLGYYSRARNLLKTAKIIQKQYRGRFPNTVEELQALPGIGRSTAGAILAISRNQATPILDGNVKRVLTRLHAIAQWPGTAPITKQLWELADYYTPQARVNDYTQAIMDLGATVCTRSHPKCPACPLNKVCQAYKQGAPERFPVSKPSKTLPTRQTQMLILTNTKHEILLLKRPPTGIWGSLWCFPEYSPNPLQDNLQAYCLKNFACKIEKINRGQHFRHTFSHFHLEITPVYLQVSPHVRQIMSASDQVWYKLEAAIQLGVAAPIKRLLKQIQDKTYETLDLLHEIE